MRRFKIHENCYPYFISASIVKWLPVFVSQKTCDIIINSLNYCRENKSLRIHSYVIMPTHIHLIVSADAGLPSVLRDFKRHTSKQIVLTYADIQNPPFINVFKFCGKEHRPPTEYKVWQEDNHPEMVMTQDFFMQKVNYIHDNPFRKGLVVDPLAWKYSSLRSFNGIDDGPLEIDWIQW